MEWTRSALVIVAVSFAVVFAVAFGSTSIREGHCDFLSFYSGAKLAGTGHLYSVDQAHSIQSQFSEPNEVRAYIRPPFYAVMLWPLAQLPYYQALYTWQVLNIAALGGFVLVSSGRPFAFALCAWFFPTWLNLSIAQDMPLVLLLVGVSQWLLSRKKEMLGGTVFAVCTMKFHLFLLLPILILAKRMWRFAAGFGLGATILAVISFAAAGLDWPSRYYQLLMINEQNQASQSYMANLNGLFHGLPYSMVWLIGATLLVVAATWRMARRLPVNSALAVALYGGLLVSPHSFMYDCMILLPLLFTLLDRMAAGRVLILSVAVGLSALSLGSPAISFVGQAALAAVFGWLAVGHGERAVT